MPQVKTRKRKYRVDQPRNVLLSGESVDLADLAKEIEQLGATLGEAKDDGSMEPAARVLDTLSNKRAGVHTVVVEMTDSVRDNLLQRHGDKIRILDDEKLFYPQSRPADADKISLVNYVPTADELVLVVRAQDPDGNPIPNARVSLSGGLWVDTGITDDQGRVTLTLIGETLETLEMLTIKPASGFWSYRIELPELVDNAENLVALQPLGALLPPDQSDFPAVQLRSWGMAAMNIGEGIDGSGEVRLAVIDSGIDKGHPDLEPAGGRDLGETDDAASTWVEDTSGHGTHVSGVCAALDNQIGILGAAARGVKLFGLRVFPEARISKIIAAIDWCIDNDVDVINMSLGGAASDEGFHEKLAEARAAGILPIAAAGNSGASVLFPAAYPEVVAVSAIGKLGTFPENSTHAAHVTDRQANGFFGARFTCFGPEVNVCAPGVAIISSVPGGGYAAWDGTSMACPHVAGLAARYLQMRAEVRDMPRDAERSQALFDLIVGSCIDLGLDSDVQGSGLPKFLEAGTGGGQGHGPTAREKLLRVIDEAIDIVQAELET